MRQRPAFVVPLCLAAAIGPASCDAGGDRVGEPIATSQGPIVGGVPESGYLGVGALVVDYGSGAMEQFCTATLINERWVLTAAHCLDTDGLEPWITSWFNGPDVSVRTGGTLIEAETFHVHPSWDGTNNDVGLVYLRAPATGLPIHTLSTTAPASGRAITWVGYGVNNGTADTGNGIKRRGSGTVDTVRTQTYSYGYDTAMPCSGDSGGPGFMTVGGFQVVGGVVSRGDENCQWSGTDTRVDRFVAWIEGEIAAGGEYVNCSILGGSCSSETCFPVETDVLGCIPNAGRTGGSSCNPDPDTWTTSVPCRDGYYCAEVTPGVGRCMHFCDPDFDCGADNHCQLPMFIGWPDIGICMPDCDLLGGDCTAGTACTLQGTGTGCANTNDRGSGATCTVHPAAGRPISCADGLACWPPEASTGRCTPYCRNDGDCAEGQMCSMPVFEEIPDVGACTCVNRDGDDWCLPDDCNDADATVYPGATEVCGNGIDDNCAGGTDEGCGCTDADGDGSCLPDDCDDANVNVRPGIAESRCDGVDDNCNGATDEGCSCTDADGDGSCAADDCNDVDASVHPGAADDCGDSVDDDCDGQTDETCGCVDEDGDGVCAGVDCDDLNPFIFPLAGEFCSDGADNDCDGLTDGPDPDCGGGGDGCECSVPGATPARHGATLALLAVVGLAIVLRRL